eukprot:gene27897-33691_t
MQQSCKRDEVAEELESCAKASIPRQIVLQMQVNSHKRKHAELMTQEENPVVKGENELRFQMLCVLRSWRGSMNQRHPAELLKSMLQTRGYSADHIVPNMPGQQSKQPSHHRLASYCTGLMHAVKLSDLETIITYQSKGHSMLACNKFSESILHTACRSATPAVVHFLLSHAELLPASADTDSSNATTSTGSSCSFDEIKCTRSTDNTESVVLAEPSDRRNFMSWRSLVDDVGRSPMHDACWRAEPLFSIIAILLDHNPFLLLFQDGRGDTPLHYVRSQHWGQWCAFLVTNQDKYWPAKSGRSKGVVDKVDNEDKKATLEEATVLDSVQR